jgi:hydrogenase expression/formation protein HypC
MCLAIPGKIVSIEDEAEVTLRRGKVDFGGVQKEICLSFTPEARTGDYVLVHVGFALSVVDEAEARQIFEDLARMEELADIQEDEREQEAAGEIP